MTAHPSPESRWRVVLLLGAIALVVIVVVVLADRTTRARVARNEEAQVMKTLQPLLPAGGYDNRPAADRILVSSPELPGSETTPLPVYRARLRGAPAAAVLTVIAPSGYVGPIRLLVAIDANGTIMAVRAESHRETPGLGDRIDSSRSDWIDAFAGRRTDDSPMDHWALRRDNGDFDEITGATITSRAVVAAVAAAARFFRGHRDEIFSRPAQ